MRGCVAVVCADTARYSMFASALARLRKPVGTEVHFVTGSDREIGRNQLVTVMLKSGHDWLLFLDDDQIFGEDLLERLLAHNEDIVGALYMRRDAPFSPIAYEQELKDGRLMPLNLNEHPSGGLVKVVAVGTGGMLIKRRVFETLPQPWFKRELRSEDVVFCLDVAELFNVYVDLDTPMGHMTTTAVWPSKVPNGWAVGFKISEETNIVVPIES